MTRIAIGAGTLGFLLSVSGSWIPSLWGDEVTSALSAERSLPSLFRMLGHVDAVHGSYYLFLHFWVDLFGTSPLALRVPSAIGIGIAAAGVAVLGTVVAGRSAGIFSTLVFVALPRVTFAGEEARSYAFSAACATWLTILLVHLLARPRTSRRWWILYAAGVAVCGYVFLFSLLILVAHGAVVVASGDRKRLRAWAIAAAVGLLLALPVGLFGYFERAQIAFLAHREDFTANSILFDQWFGNPIAGVIGWLLVIAAFVVPLALRSRLPGLVLFGVWALAPTVILVTANAVDPMYSSRYLTFCAPGIALLIGSFLASLRRRWIAIGSLVLFAAAASLSYVHDRTPYAMDSSGWAEDAAAVHVNARPGQAILFDESAQPWERPRLALGGYPQDFAGLDDVALKHPWYQTDGWSDTVYPLGAVLPRLDHIRTVWVLEYKAAGAKADTRDIPTLESDGYVRAKTVREHDLDIIEFQRARSIPRT